MGAVLSFVPTQDEVNAAWQQHRALAAAIIADPKLLLDRHHMEATARAERAFKSAFLRFDATTGNGEAQ